MHTVAPLEKPQDYRKVTGCILSGFLRTCQNLISEGAIIMPGFALVEQLTSLITYLLSYPGGLNILLGKIPPPDADDIHAMLETAWSAGKDPGVRISKSRNRIMEAERRILDEEDFNKIIERAGGWEHIHAVTAEWREAYLPSWRLIVDTMRWTTSRVDGMSQQMIADRHAVSRDWVSKTIREFPQRLAVAILNTPVGEHEKSA